MKSDKFSEIQNFNSIDIILQIYTVCFQLSILIITDPLRKKNQQSFFIANSYSFLALLFTIDRFLDEVPTFILGHFPPVCLC